MKRASLYLSTILPLLSLSFVGCFNLGAGKRGVLELPLPQAYLLPNAPAAVWPILVAEATRSGGTVLVNDEVTGVVSWISEIRESDGAPHSSLHDLRIGARRGTVMGITMIRVESAPGGSRLTVRQAYLPAQSPFGATPSRGDYERWLADRIRDHLTSKPEENP